MINFFMYYIIKLAHNVTLFMNKNMGKSFLTKTIAGNNNFYILVNNPPGMFPKWGNRRPPTSAYQADIFAAKLTREGFK